MLNVAVGPIINQNNACPQRLAPPPPRRALLSTTQRRNVLSLKASVERRGAFFLLSRRHPHSSSKGWAPEIEKLVLDRILNHCASEYQTAMSDRDLIERYVDRVIVKPQALEVRLVRSSEASAQAQEPGINEPAPDLPTTVTTLTLAWTAPSFAAVKGIIHAPSAKRAMKSESRDALLTAIAKSRGWIADIRLGRIASLAEIAKHETLGERHIRLLAPLAFVSPRIVAAIVDGTAPADLTVTGLAKALPYSWTEQDNSIGLLE